MLRKSKAPCWGRPAKTGDETAAASRVSVASVPPQGVRVNLYVAGRNCPVWNRRGLACWGWLAEDGDGKELKQMRSCTGDNPLLSLPLLSAALAALYWTVQNAPVASVTLYLSSQRAVEDLAGGWEVQEDHLTHMRATLAGLVTATGTELVYLPVERNPAEKLADRAYTDFVDPLRWMQALGVAE